MFHLVFIFRRNVTYNFTPISNWDYLIIFLCSPTCTNSCKMERDRRDTVQILIIIFIISNFWKFTVEMILGSGKVNNYRVSVKFKDRLVSRIKKIIKIVTDGTKM